MAITARAWFKRLKKRLEDSSKHTFQRVCFDLFSVAWPDLQYAPDLGLHDRRGVDLFSFCRQESIGSDSWDYEVVVQCKGVERKQFDEGNYRAAVEDVEKFRKTKLRTRRYWLVLNRSAIAPGWAGKLKHAVDELAASGAAAEARWFDPQALLVVLFEELVIQAKRRIREKNAEQLERYNAAMREHEHYVVDVPYHLRIRKGVGARARWVNHTGRNALEALAMPARDASAGVQRFRLVVSEFGFGKTLLLLQLANRLGQSGQAVLYQPVVELARDSFSNEFSLVKSIYERVFPEDETPNKTADHPPLAAFREVLRFDPMTVLLLDGLDEHTRPYSFEGIRDVFRSLKDLACDVIVSARKEFFDAYEGNFDEAMSGTGNDRQFLSLDEWDNQCILEFLDACGSSEGIQAFRERVRRGEYEEHYGDIPKRPLFLDMLARDLNEDPSAARDLATLYQDYLTRKMSRDLQSPFQIGEGAGRPSPTLDLSSFRKRLIELQERLAAASLEHVDGVEGLVLRGEITEDEVRAAARDVGLDQAQLPELLQHSVLIPSGKSARAALVLRFAHRSLQEFLAASWLVKSEGAQALSRKPRLPAGVVRFAEQILRSATINSGDLHLQNQHVPVYRTGIVGATPVMEKILNICTRVATTDSTVLIAGESGTGKELIARFIHSNSRRSGNPFIAVNCGAIPCELLETELFGHEKGGLTGAVGTRMGMFQLANGGTIFLDEIGEMSTALQVELLRVLQEREIRPVGADRTIKIDVRVVAASNRDLVSEVEKGRFREDLFYRLQVIPITVPPLRDRRSDIPLLVQHFVNRFATKAGRKIERVPREEMQRLVAYSWPGNVRELENLIERAVVLSTGPDLQVAAEVAGLIERDAREKLRAGDFKGALEDLLGSITVDAARKERIVEEFAFAFRFDNSLGTSLQLETDAHDAFDWRWRVWQVLAARNSFPLARERKLEFASRADQEQEQTAETATATSSMAATANTEETPEEKGEKLERAVARLFRTFFRFGEDVPWKIRPQKRGTQGGYDLSIEWSGQCETAMSHWVRCHVECKNYANEITQRDVAEKLLSEPQQPAVIQHWIVISPRGNPSNELNRLLEQWQKEKRFPFEVQAWCPETGVDEFFGLEPDVYDQFFVPAEGQPHPRTWDQARRDRVTAKWKARLAPPLRLPNGWPEYVRDPSRLCSPPEDADELSATFDNYVPMRCRNTAGALLEKPLRTYVEEWLQQPDKQVLFVLGEFGDGKTCFTYALARCLLKDWQGNRPTGWLPLRLTLKKFPGNAREFLRQRLEEFSADVGGWLELGKTFNRLVILDGFDEMSVRLDPAAVTKNIGDLLACVKEFEGCKLLITSRTHFFENRQDAQRLMARLGDPAVYHLAPIEREEVARHLLGAVSDEKARALLAQIHRMNDPIGLASKPLFLEMLKEVLKEVLADPSPPNDLDVLDLYERYIEQALTRKPELLDDPEFRADPRETVKNLRKILCQIAEDLQRTGQGYVSLSKYQAECAPPFAQLLWRLSGSSEADKDARSRVGARSLLGRVVREDIADEWPVDFCHRSMREYFVALSLCCAKQLKMETSRAPSS